MFRLHFDTTAFYEDLCAVCVNARGKRWGGEVMKRYNGWLTLDLDKKRKDDTVKDAIAKIAAL